MKQAKKSKKQQHPKKSTAVTMPRSMSYSPVSDQHHAKLTWTGTFSSVITTFSNVNFGIVNPGTRIPKYWDQFFAFYKFAYIECVHLSIEMVNLDVRPLRVVLAESNTDDVVPTTFLELSETPRAKLKIASQGGNHQVVYLRAATRGSAILGHKLEDDSAFWNTQTGAPTAATQPLLVLGLEPIMAGSACNVSYTVTLKYDIKFFTLNHL